MRRREFITLLGGAAAAWPLAARAQQPKPMRRIGALMNLAADDPEAPGRVAAFAQGLGELGWTIGRNVRIDARWAAGNVDNFRKYAAELVALAPDGILSHVHPGRRGVATGNPHGADRVRAGYRPSRRRLGREPGAARR
jgi:putative tryptophan/tyrosine transport system substrate-binding protein